MFSKIWTSFMCRRSRTTGELFVLDYKVLLLRTHFLNSLATVSFQELTPPPPLNLFYLGNLQ